jgi:hypothetical protein
VDYVRLWYGLWYAIVDGGTWYAVRWAMADGDGVTIDKDKRKEELRSGQIIATNQASTISSFYNDVRFRFIA